MNPFTKRTFTWPLLARSLAGSAVYLPVLGKSLIRPAIEADLREKIMLGVTSVNDCRYCSWVHTGLALRNGVDMADLQLLLGEQLSAGINEQEAVAILFGKHYADTVRQPDAKAREQLKQHFSLDQRLEIMAYIQVIYFSNLTGNSADAVLARLMGRRVDGNVTAQIAAAIIGAPVLGMIWWKSRQSERTALAAL